MGFLPTGLNQKLKVGEFELTYNAWNNIEKELQEAFDLVMVTSEMTGYKIMSWASSHIEHGGHIVVPFHKDNDERIKLTFLVTQGFKLRATQVINFHNMGITRTDHHRRTPELKAEQLLLRLKKVINEF